MTHAQKFANDKELGELVEVLVVNAMIDKYANRVSEVDAPNENELKDFDVKFTIGSRPITMEIKYDQMCAETGNFAIETQYKGQPSGLIATKSLLFTIVDPPVAYVFASQKLREICRRLVMDGKAKRVTGGDGNECVMYLIKKNLLIEYVEFTLPVGEVITNG